MTQPTGTKKMTYTMDEYIKNKDTHEALRRNGGAESLPHAANYMMRSCDVIETISERAI